jgi:hypothetical protein
MRRALNPEIALGFLIATLLWIGVLGWQASYAPTDSEKRQCEETAHKSGHKAEECKTLWERTTTDPVAFFTFWLVVSTIGLGVSTVLLWRAGEKQIRLSAEAAAAQSRDMQASIQAVITAERPYLALKITEPGVQVGEQGQIRFAGQRLRFKFVNHGNTPGLLDEVKEVCRVMEGLLDAPPPLDPMRDRGIMVPIGTVSARDAPYVAAINLLANLEDGGTTLMLKDGAWNERRMFFQGFVRYRDAFGTHYINGFLACFSPEGKTWVLRGGDEYNYSRTERPEDIPPHPKYS